MKRFLAALMVFIVTALAMPTVVFAAEEPLEDIPKRSYSKSSKAYCMYEENDGKYTLTYVNSAGTKLLYKSDEKFEHDNSLSDDGKTLFYSINDTVYKYSYESGKRQKIYTAGDTYITLYASPSGEYCLIFVEHLNGYDKHDNDIVIWHKGKTVSQTEYGDPEEPIVLEGTTLTDMIKLYGINDKGEAFYTLDRDIYILDRDGKRLAQKAPVPLSDNEYDYSTRISPGSGTYTVFYGKDLYFGAVGGEQHKMSFPGYAGSYVIDYNGEGIIIYNGEYVARYDIKSGKSKNILKISPEKYMEKRRYFMKASGDLNEAAYINYSKNKLVRLSGWDGENNCYTKKQEIMLNGTGQERITDYTSDMNTILINYADEKNYYWTADFDGERFVNTGYWNETDRFGHMIVKSGGKIKIITLDGGVAEVFDGVGITCEPYLSNGFYVFYSGGPDDCYEYDGNYPLTYYYIDKNGKAVKWYEKTVYMFILY